MIMKETEESISWRIKNKKSGRGMSIDFTGVWKERVGLLDLSSM